MIVEVAYAEREQQTLVQLDLPSDATVSDALKAAKASFPEVDLEASAVGVFGQICERDRPLRDWDRVEIYRPLVMDAKAARRQRALEQKSSIGNSKKDA